MPMDNNDNQYPGLSEENSKITSVLHPYGLPKFDFDHTHIRFDSLAENEVFLGISSREENHWIEDFSRGNSVIEFGASAAECCSIPRHVDVWSEATSSESVEMLLKSVGQEEMLPGESIIEESDACGELGTLAKEMELNPRPDGNRNNQESDLEVPKVQPSDNISRPIEVSEVADVDPKCSSLTQVDDSASGCSVNLKSGLVVHECNSQDKESCDDEHQPKLGTSLNESLNYNMEGTLVLGTQRFSDFSHCVKEDVEFSNGQDSSSAKPLDTASNEPTQKNACYVNDASVCSLSDVNHSSMSEFPILLAPNEGSTQNFQESSSIATKEESSLPMKGHCQDMNSVESCHNAEDLVLSESLEIKQSADVSEKSFGCSEGDLRVDKQDASSRGVEVRIVDIKCEQLKDFQSPTSHAESSVESKEMYQVSHIQINTRVSTTTSEGNIPGTELGIHIIEDPDNHVNNLPILTDASQSSQSVTEHITENQNRRNGATPNLEDAVLFSEIVRSVEAANSGKQDPGDVSSKPVILYNDTARLSSSSLDEEVKKEIAMEECLQQDNSSAIKSESNVGSSSSITASHERSQGTTDEIGEQNEELNLPSDVQPMHLDKIADRGTNAILKEPPSLKVPSQVESETGTVPSAEISLAFNIPVVEVIHRDSSLPSTCIDAAPLNEGILVKPNETLGCSDTMDVVNVPCNSNVVVAEEAEAVATVENMKTNIDNSCQAGLSEASEADKPSHDVASVISGSKIPAPNKKMNEGHMEPAAEHVSDSAFKAGEVPSVPKNDSVPNNDGASEGSRNRRSFSFDVPPVAEKESGSTPSGSQKNHGGKEVPQVTNLVTEGGNVSIGAKTTSEPKTRRGSGKPTKKTVKKGNNVRQPEDNTSCSLVSQSGPPRLLQFGVGVTESSCRKSTASPVPSSNLPDLNTSIPASALFHQPFTDSQQVQLRAQIFVYGSLIQGTAPDEPCMVSAFGTSDGGRTSWEPKWRACVERFHSQKTVSNSYCIPIQSRSGSKGQDKSGKPSTRRSKAGPSPVNLFGNKETPSIAVKPMIPLSSSLWNLQTPLSDGLPPSNVIRGVAPQARPPLHPFQTPPARTFGGQTTSWLSPASISGPRVSSSRSPAFDLSTHFSSTSAEIVKLTPLSDSPLEFSSSMKHEINAPISTLVQDSSMQNLPIYPVIHKSRKKRKSSTAEESPQNSLLTTSVLPNFDAITSNSSKKGPAVARLSSISSHPFTHLIGGHFSTTVAVTASPAVVVHPIQRSELQVEKNFSHRDQLKQVEEAKLSGEDAVANAADLVSRCQSVWSAMEKQKNLSLAPDLELQLSSSAAAMAAAASVAKAAAAAAKLASTAALHFHQVAIQVLHGNAIPAQKSETSISGVGNNLSDASPASILRSGNGNDAPNSIISAAREAARRRVEDALVASQHAENLDAIVKAAELAAEAVSQAGRVVSMGEPLPLSLLVEAGPENYWRGDLQLVKFSTEKGNGKDIGSSKEVCKQSVRPSDCTMVDGSSVPKDIARDLSKNIRVDEAISASHISVEKGISGAKDSPIPDHTGTGGLASDHADAESVPLQDVHGRDQKTLGDDCIKENCSVEVFKDGGCFKGAWYSAKVLSLNDEKALVCFTDLQSDKESDSLKEWIPLEGEGNNVPNIRVAHPISGAYFDRTRKRGRSALTEYQWSVGDRVDAWFKDCWREGVITEQNNNDSTTFSVHFPAHGETSVVKAWHLRTTLIWKNGKWVELLSSRQSALSQGDTPLGKRLRLGNTVEVGRGAIPKAVDSLQLENVAEPNLLPLSSTEKVFNIGTNRGDNKVAAPRMTRSGLQKEGLKFFGVPRPGKKRKFMEVSKHIVSERSTKNDVPNDSSKLSKYMMPQGTGSRGFRNSSKVDVKEKQFAESKLKAPNTGKLPGISSRALSQKENSTSATSGPHEINNRSHTVKGSISNNERGSSNLIRSGAGSNHEAAFDVPISTQCLPPDRNKKTSKNINSERTMIGKLAVAGGRTDAAAEDKLLPDLTGTRRSNRRIQPTSRLLEGLQSSLITSKIPSASHDRSHRLQRKFASRGDL